MSPQHTQQQLEVEEPRAELDEPALVKRELVELPKQQPAGEGLLEDLETRKAIESEALYKLSDEQIAAYRRDGHIVIRGAKPREDVENTLCEIEHLIDKLGGMYGPEELEALNLCKLNNIWKLDKEIRKFVLSKRLAGIAAQLMGVEGVRLYHDQLLFKRPDQDITTWHQVNLITFEILVILLYPNQDGFYWPLAPEDLNKVMTAWIPFVPVTEENGGLIFASGSHEDGYIGDRPSDVEDVDAQFFNDLVEKRTVQGMPNSP
jgi:hypothetical protein